MLITLDKVHLEAPLAKDGSIVVLTELILPRPAIALRRAMLEVSVKKGKRSMAQASFVDKALLKERVDGPFGLRVAVTRPANTGEFGELLSDILSTGIQNAGDILARMAFTTPPARRIAMFPTNLVADAVQDTSPRFLADGTLDLESKGLTSGVLTVPLKLSQTVREATLPAGPRNRPSRKPAATQTFRKGSIVGWVALRAVL